MQETEFDRFAEEYRSQHAANISASGESPDFFAEYKIQDIANIANARGLSRAGIKILDFGAGIGNSVPFFNKYFSNARIICLDVSRKSLDLGRSRFGEIAEFIHFDGGEPPIPDKSIDIILCACVFHHIPHDQHQKILVGLRRKLSERGLLFLFEHNPLNPLTVRAVDTCPFDENAKLITSWKLSESLKLAGFATVETRFRIFFPGLLRKLRPLETYLYWLPLGAQYCLIAA